MATNDEIMRAQWAFLREREMKWDRRYLEVAKFVGDRWSKDPSSKVGAVLVDEEGRMVPGYNGFPRGLSDADEIYADRDKKMQRMIHAELNAILNVQGRTKGLTLYTSRYPSCSRCAAHVIQAGISRVVYEIHPDGIPERWEADMKAALAMYKEAGIPVIGIRL